jgi:hypothetical protein
MMDASSIIDLRQYLAKGKKTKKHRIGRKRKGKKGKTVNRKSHQSRKHRR